MRTATWSDLGRFFEVDGWQQTRQTGDIHFEKVLVDTREVLQSKMSAGKGSVTIGRNLFAEICRMQLRVTQQQFWACLETGQPAPRPAPTAPEPANAMPAWLAIRLHAEIGLTLREISELTESQARQMLDEFRSRPRDEPRP